MIRFEIETNNQTLAAMPASFSFRERRKIISLLGLYCDSIYFIIALSIIQTGI